MSKEYIVAAGFIATMAGLGWEMKEVGAEGNFDFDIPEVVCLLGILTMLAGARMK